MIIRVILSILLGLLLACSAPKPIDISEKNSNQAKKELTEFQTLSLASAKARFSEPDLAEDIIIDNNITLQSYQNTNSYPTLNSQLKREGEVILIHAEWHRYQHITAVTYHQQQDQWQPISAIIKE